MNHCRAYCVYSATFAHIASQLHAAGGKTFWKKPRLSSSQVPVGVPYIMIDLSPIVHRMNLMLPLFGLLCLLICPSNAATPPQTSRASYPLVRSFNPAIFVGFHSSVFPLGSLRSIPSVCARKKLLR